MFEVSKKQPVNLQTLYEALLTLQPTSVKAESALCGSGLFVSKLRSCLHDSTIEGLCFMQNALQMQRTY